MSDTHYETADELIRDFRDYATPDSRRLEIHDHLLSVLSKNGPFVHVDRVYFIDADGCMNSTWAKDADEVRVSPPIPRDTSEEGDEDPSDCPDGEDADERPEPEVEVVEVEVGDVGEGETFWFTSGCVIKDADPSRVAYRRQDGSMGHVPPGDYVFVARVKEDTTDA